MSAIAGRASRQSVLSIQGAQAAAKVRVRLPRLGPEADRDVWIVRLWETGLVDTADIGEMLGIGQPRVCAVLRRELGVCRSSRRDRHPIPALPPRALFVERER